jgi:hypothetical protein
MTNLIVSTYILLLTNWTDITPPIGFEQKGDYIVWNGDKSPRRELIAHVRTNVIGRIVYGGKTNEITLSEGEPFLEIHRTLTPTVTTTWSTNEEVKPYQPPRYCFTNQLFSVLDWDTMLITNVVVASNSVRIPTNTATQRK